MAEPPHQLPRYRNHVYFAIGTLLSVLAGLPLLASAKPCPQPGDRFGPRYEALSGTYRSRGLSSSGGTFVVVIPRRAAAPIAVAVTGAVFDDAASLPPGTQITLFGYVGNSLSGAHPPFSCLEPRQAP